jgi:hypothetical protein
MDLALEQLDALETPTAAEFFAGFVQGLTVVGVGVAIAAGIAT